MRVALWISMVVLSALSATGCVTHVDDGGSRPADVEEKDTDDPSTDDPVAPGACTALEGKTFASVSEGECGLGPDGPSLCTWHITFASDTPAQSRWDWQHSDYGQSGTVQCAGGVLTAQTAPPFDEPYTGTFDAVQNKLVWDGVDYVVSP